MSVFKCKMCGGTLEINENATTAECEYCGSIQTLTKSRDEIVTNLFNRANNLRMKSEFDKAQEMYEKIVAQDSTDAEAYWGILLCKYGIEYVEDPSTFKRVPTCHRAQIESVLTDVDYQSAIENADINQKILYEKQAKEIEEVQKGILEISSKEEPFDVFICYKQSDENGNRTVDSVLANDIYYQLTQEGFKVFYAAITLEDKIGQEYEPYIFAALNSAKVMLVLGTKPEYFNAVWVKNEWSRYLKIIKKDRSKLLIPCYKDMDAYDLPEEFSHLQAQDMGKIGFINDVVRGIKKVLDTTLETSNVVQTNTAITSDNSQVGNLLKRVFIFLEDKNWESADEYCEKVLDLDPENAEAYLGKLMISLQVIKREKLVEQDKTFDNNEYYQKVMRYGDEKLRAEISGYNEGINEKINNRIYQEALKYSNMDNNIAGLQKAIQILGTIPNYKDSKQLQEQFEKEIVELKNQEIYQKALNLMENANRDGELDQASELFKSLEDYLDSRIKAEECQKLKIEMKYKSAVGKQNMMGSINLRDAIEIYRELGDYKDCRERERECIDALENYNRQNIYTKAEEKREQNTIESLNEAIEMYQQISNYKDANQRIEECKNNIYELQKFEMESAKKYSKRESLRSIKRTVIWEIIIIVLVIFIFLIMNFGQSTDSDFMIYFNQYRLDI